MTISPHKVSGDTNPQAPKLTPIQADAIGYGVPGLRKDAWYYHPGKRELVCLQGKTAAGDWQYYYLNLKRSVGATKDFKVAPESHFADYEPAEKYFPEPKPEKSDETEVLRQQLADQAAQIEKLSAELAEVQRVKRQQDEKIRAFLTLIETPKVKPKPTIGQRVYNVNSDGGRAEMAAKYAECLQNNWPIHQFISLGAVIRDNSIQEDVLMVWEEKPKTDQKAIIPFSREEDKDKTA